MQQNDDPLTEKHSKSLKSVFSKPIPWIFSGLGTALIFFLLNSFFRDCSTSTEKSSKEFSNVTIMKSPVVDSSSQVRRVVDILIDSIEARIDGVPPFQREDVAKYYIGMRVNWKMRLLTMERLSDALVAVLLSNRMYSYTVCCVVSPKVYQQLAIVREGTPIEVVGEIESIKSRIINLKNATLTF